MEGSPLVFCFTKIFFKKKKQVTDYLIISQIVKLDFYPIAFPAIEFYFYLLSLSINSTIDRFVPNCFCFWAFLFKLFLLALLYNHKYILLSILPNGKGRSLGNFVIFDKFNFFTFDQIRLTNNFFVIGFFNYYP